MTTITWNISQLNCLPQAPEGADYVVTAHWTLIGTDGTYTGSTYGSVGITLTEGSTFTPYADLTLDQVLGWVWTNGVDKDAQEAAVAAQIENQINPTVVTPPLPWSA